MNAVFRFGSGMVLRRESVAFPPSVTGNATLMRFPVQHKCCFLVFWQDSAGLGKFRHVWLHLPAAICSYYGYQYGLNESVSRRADGFFLHSQFSNQTLCALSRLCG